MKRFLSILFLACFCFAPPVGALVESNVLSAQDVKIYKNIFNAHKKGAFKTAASLEKQLKDKSLMGYVLYDRYFSKGYKTKPAEIVAWMQKYDSLPVASDMYALGKQKKARLPQKRPPSIFGSKTTACTFVMREEPIDLIRNRAFTRLPEPQRKKAKALMNKIAKYVSSCKTLNAKNLIESKEARDLFTREELDMARTALAFSYFLDDEDDLALDMAQQAIRGSKKQIPLASWTAGLVSWRLGNYDQAASYFETVAGLEKTYPLLRASSAFWAARSHLRLGNYKKVGDYLELASEYPRTFYGYLAMRMLAQDPYHVWETPLAPEDDIGGQFSHPALNRFYALRQVGKTQWAKKELSQLYVEADKEAKGILYIISQRNGFSDEILALSGELSGEDVRYPAPKWTPQDGWKVDKALVFSFVKQESCFNSRAQSAAGAVGLMQIMPGTARELAQSMQYPWSLRRLHDPAYNLSLGQNYLLQIMCNVEVNNNLIFTAVAYNAGPGNLAKWKKRMNYQNDPLLFIESIPSKETRSFVERIMVNYWVYRSLMGQPTLSLDDVASGKWPIYQSHD